MENLWERDQLKGLSVDGRITLKYIVRKQRDKSEAGVLQSA
jgi:hypothetical protein